MGLLTLPTIFSVIVTDRNRKCNILGTGESGEVLEWVCYEIRAVILNIMHHHILKLCLQVLVVITDKGSGLNPTDIEAASEALHNKGIKVVPVAVGNEADSSELELTSPERFVIEAPRNEDPQKLGQQIMEHVIRRKWLGMKGKPLCRRGL